MDDILTSIHAAAPADLLVGFETADDAGVYRLDAERAVVCTADFITPVVDDAFTFGRVAAANSLSDVYAMGGKPLLALNLLGYPPAGVPNAVLGEILKGAAATCAEAGCAVAGGHTVRDNEVKFGLSVTGLVHPDRILRNSDAQPGDVLLLSKPLGTGALVAAMKKGRLDEAGYEALVTAMTTLNTCGAHLCEAGAHAVTDVTGFGLTGHAREMASAADACFVFDTTALPLLPEAVELCAEGFTCGGTKSNAAHTGETLRLAAELPDGMEGLLHDPQTSGGLLVAAPADRVDQVLAAMAEHGALCTAVVGEVTSRTAGDPFLDFRG
ncbi:MAG: selenide, water dikinase SelD [bacterium]|nr:selenide, water dikinase SelD [bacterium]